MKRKLQVYTAFLIICILATACGQEKHNIKPSKELISDNVIKNDKTKNNAKADTERYTEYISTIDKGLKAFRKNECGNVRYGTFSGYYYYSNLTSQESQNLGLSEKQSNYYPIGEIISYLKNDSLIGFRMQIRWNTKGNYQKGGDFSYQCERLFIGNMVYYSCTSDCVDKDEIPSFMSIDGISHVGFTKKTQKYTGKYKLHKVNRDKEFIKLSGHLYVIDRKKHTIHEVENGNAKIYTNWCDCQQKDILTAQKSYHLTPAKVQALIPKGYKIDKADYNYSVADIDSDGIDDILVEIYPILNHYKYNGDYTEDSPYRHVNKYGYHQLWILKGTKDGSFEPKKLMNSIVWDEVYTLCNIVAYDGGFTMEYFIGRSPFETVLRKFQYDKKKMDWYLARQYENNSYLFCMEQGLTIEGPLEYGTEYLLNKSSNKYYKVSLQNYIQKKCPNLSELGYDDSGSLFSFTDKHMAVRITKIIKNELHKIFASMKNLGECQDVFFYDRTEVFLNAKTLVMCFIYSDDIQNGISVDRVIPICIDLKTCTLIDFKKYFSSEEFVKLCENSDIKIKNLKKLYEHYGDYEYFLKAGNPSIALCLTEEGFVILETNEVRPNYYTITRDKLVQTPLMQFWDDWP